MYDPQLKSGTVQRKHQEKSDERQGCTRTQKLDKGPRPETAAVKQERIQLDPHEDPRAGDLETSSQDFQRVTDNQGLHHMEGSTPSETEDKPPSNVSV
jgi:hypothetical protein